MLQRRYTGHSEGRPRKRSAVGTQAVVDRQKDTAPPRRELRGVVERITYQNPENGYTVARLTPERAAAEVNAVRQDDRLVTVVGTLADLTPGEAIVAHGWWHNDPKHEIGRASCRERV